jgi:hypothetical protein
MRLKSLFIVAAFFVAAFQLQGQTFENGGKYVHAGVGFGSGYIYTGSRIGVPPIHVSYEQGINDRFGVGGLIGFTSSRYESMLINDKYTWRFSYLVLGARGAYHFTEIDQADVYAGAMLGYNIASSRFESTNAGLNSSLNDPKIGGLVYGAYVGARYELNNDLTLFGELGYSIAYLNLGVCFKL